MPLIETMIRRIQLPSDIMVEAQALAGVDNACDQRVSRRAELIKEM